MKKMTSEIITDENSIFRSFYKEIFEGSDFDEIFENMKNEIVKVFEEYMNKGSGWIFEKNIKVILNVNNIRVLGASSYFPLPEYLKKKEAIVNPKNDDKKCFLWCVRIAELLKTNPNLRNPQRISNILKKKVEKFNVDGMEFPCGFKDIVKFEKNNNISINVFGYEDKEQIIFPLKPNDKKCDNVINLLLLGNENGKKHYCLIKDMSRLLSCKIN